MLAESFGSLAVGDIARQTVPQARSCLSERLALRQYCALMSSVIEDVLVLHGRRLSSKTLRSNNLSLDKAITVAQNRPLWRLMSAFGATHP